MCCVLRGSRRVAAVFVALLLVASAAGTLGRDFPEQPSGALQPPAPPVPPATGGGGGASGPPHPLGSFSWDEVWQPNALGCCAILFAAGALCSAAGIGGGGVYVAVLMLVGGLSPRDAVPLSKSVVFFGAASSLAVNLGVKDPWGGSAGRLSVIDLDACRVVVPASLCGTYLGVLLNWHAKDAAIVQLLCALMVAMTCMVTRAAWRQYREEEDERRRGMAPAAGGAAAAQALLSSSGAAAAAAGSGEPAMRNPQDDEEDGADWSRRAASGLAAEEGALPPEGVAAEEEPLLGERRRGTPSCCAGPSTTDLALAAVLTLVVVLGGVLRVHAHRCRAEQEAAATADGAGSDTGEGSACAHPVARALLWWGKPEELLGDPQTAAALQHAAITLPICACVAAAAFSAGRANEDPKWPRYRVLAYQVTAVATGVLAGLAGIGGGLILSPFFLLTGMDAAVAVGTSSTCVLFTSASTAIQYLLTDRIVLSLALVYGAVAAVASSAGTALVHALQQHGAGRRSPITAVVAAGVALSTVLSLAKLVHQQPS